MTKKSTEPKEEQELTPATIQLPKGGLRGLMVLIANLQSKVAKLEERLN